MDHVLSGRGAGEISDEAEQFLGEAGACLDAGVEGFSLGLSETVVVAVEGGSVGVEFGGGLVQTSRLGPKV